MQAKDIPELPVLRFLLMLRRQMPHLQGTWFAGPDNALFTNSVQHAMPHATPAKVALAKMRAMIKKGLVEGCGCGCRGGFELTEKGKLVLENASQNNQQN